MTFKKSIPISIFQYNVRKELPKIFNLNKRQKLVFSVLILSLSFFFLQFLNGVQLFIATVILAILTDVLLFFILRNDVKKTFFYPILVLPFFYSLSFPFFYTLVPDRLISQFIITTLYAFGLYSLFLTQNIFAVSGIRTINLLRSARIVAFVLTLLVLFFLFNFAFSLRQIPFLTPLLIFLISLFMNFESLWSYSLNKSQVKEIIISSFIIAFCLMQLSLVLILWPVNAAVYSLFLTGIFYTFSGLVHAWLERRLFKGILWEYIWVGFISVLFLIVFSRWGV